ncbi:MAG: GAF domain-containing SpoIIE family protein phosphatase [Rhodothermales bacterium]
MASTPPTKSPEQLARENDRLRRSVEELSLLNDLAVAIGGAGDSRHIVETIVRKAMKSLHAEQGDIIMISSLAEQQTATFIRASDSEVQRDSIHMNESLLGWMMIHKRAIIVNDPLTDARFKGAVWNADIRNFLSVPLLVRSTLIGLLTVYNKIGDRELFNEDDQRLLAIIATQSAQVLENARLMEEERALQRMNEELRLANEIQSSLFPQSLPAIDGYEIAGSSIAAQRVGGDYYDALAFEDGRIGLCVGDASGKGLPASLLMANVQATLRSLAPWSDSCSECLTRINSVVCDRNRKGSFVTLIYALLDPTQHALHYANAGHNRPLICRTGGEIEQLNVAGAMLGFTTRIAFPEGETALGPGDVLLLYSDGLNEAWNDAHVQFGEERIAEILRDSRAETAEGIVERLTRAVQRHAGSAPQSDDMTLLVVKRTAPRAVAA